MKILTKEKNRVCKKNTSLAVSKETCPAIIPDMLSDKQRHIQIIGLFTSFKGIKFDSKEEQRSFIVRHVKPAKLLSPYSDEKIIKIMRLLRDKATFDWGIETALKYIDNPNPEKNCFFGKDKKENNIIIG